MSKVGSGWKGRQESGQVGPAGCGQRGGFIQCNGNSTEIFEQEITWYDLCIIKWQVALSGNGGDEVPGFG